MRAVGIAGSLFAFVWTKAARRPIDSFALFAAIAGSLLIVVNAVYLQSGPLPAPFFTTSLPAPAAHEVPARRIEASVPLPPVPAPSASSKRSRAAAAARRGDPIGALIGQTSRIIAVQHALTDYGYGQIKATGVIDGPTRAAIERFEREHNMPITGQVSDRLVNELAILIGHPLD